MIDYGAKGCRCWPEGTPAYGLPSERWMPNAACPHHGLLADFTERKDTGVYTVVSRPTGCTCSVNDPHPCAYCWRVQAELDMQRIAASGEDLSEEPDAWTPETTEQERQRGLRAAVQRVRERFWDWRTRKL